MTTPLLSIPMRYFLEVARSGSVNQAAARLFVASSAVSRQITKLEESLGTPLFERRARGMALTAAGERLAAHLRNAVLDAGQVIDQVRNLGDERAGRIRAACTEGFAGSLMPVVMRTFELTHARSQFELHVGAPDEVSALLVRGEADIGLKYVVAPEPGLRIEHSAVAPVFAVMCPDHPLARQRVVTVAEVVRYPLAVGSRGGTTTRQLFDLACSEQGLQYRANFVSNYSAALLPLMRSPDIVLAGHHTVLHLIDAGTLVARPFADAQLQQRRLQVLSLEGRTLPPLAQAFVQHLVGAIASTGRRKLGRAQAARPEPAQMPR
ncbi:LysR family transcriptional regulator [Variovorax fucosicus]|uniref:LysR family transcriptional regulator n=1 Tax=Variovorax fucosicus TaxID=3053517 RepID=UPI002575DADC|nr:LysR family transcriptional regulator [Variovorax sp. J22G47]MDM0057842.1 LysR family transcriptional regulator [Variovorax sp. J22G47]